MSITADHLHRAAWLCGLDESELDATAVQAQGDATGAAGLAQLLVCPACHGELNWRERDVECTSCKARYDLVDGIAVLRPAAVHEQKEAQASYFDQAPPEFEISRPHGTPWLYRWLLGEKFRRSLDALALPEAGFSAATICGGSGMDAEFLSRVGASVVTTDISLGAARRARERATRFGLDVLPVVADAEALPFRDGSIDLVYVHDGLHHLDSPVAGLREMLRTSRLAISINEPARARATMLAARIGLSEHYEDAGNFIARVDPEMLVAELEAAGFEVVKNERYAMVYRHEPGRAAQILSQPGLRNLTRSALQAFNAVAGGVGNKLTLQALRTMPLDAQANGCSPSSRVDWPAS